MHFFQHKLLVLTTLNSCFILVAVPMDPARTFLLVAAICTPYFRRAEKELERDIEQAFEDDVSLEYYKQPRPGANGQPGQGEQDGQAALPGASGRERESFLSKLNLTLDNPFLDFLLSTGVLIWLIYSRKDIVPDVMHFITCFVDEEADFLWIMFLWLTRKCYLTMGSSF
jgi:hypothetical protein